MIIRSTRSAHRSGMAIASGVAAFLAAGPLVAQNAQMDPGSGARGPRFR